MAMMHSSRFHQRPILLLRSTAENGKIKVDEDSPAFRVFYEIESSEPLAWSRYPDRARRSFKELLPNVVPWKIGSEGTVRGGRLPSEHVVSVEMNGRYANSTLLSCEAESPLDLEITRFSELRCQIVESLEMRGRRISVAVEDSVAILAPDLAFEFLFRYFRLGSAIDPKRLVAI
jgi:hypothetical protein